MGKNWASIYYNMKFKSLWGGHEIPSLNLEARAQVPKYLLDEIKKHQEIEERDSMYVIPRR